MDYIETYRKVGKSEINEVEKQLGLELPQEYKEFLLFANGGRPKKPVLSFYHKINERSQLGMVHRFFGINANEYNDFVKHYKLYEKRIPENLIPIANDPGGNLVCLSKSGAVYFWDHNYEVEETELPDFENVFLISVSFQEFIANLKSHEEAEV